MPGAQCCDEFVGVVGDDEVCPVGGAHKAVGDHVVHHGDEGGPEVAAEQPDGFAVEAELLGCLLYTSDAADE